MSPKVTDSPYAEKRLREMIAEDAEDWNSRKTLARLLFDRGDTREAAQLLWDAPEIPSIDFELAFAARILAKGLPRRAIRLLNALLEQNRGKAAQNLGLANALLHHGMVLQAARFYGAAIEADPDGEMFNADLEHFLVWVDDRQKLWGEFENEKDELDELPWIKRDARQADALKKAMEGHTTPILVPGLPRIPAEDPEHTMYIQSPRLGAEPTPPPSVTIPMDRVADKDRVYDEDRGAATADPETGTGPHKPIYPPLGAAAVSKETTALSFNPAPAPASPKPTPLTARPVPVPPQHGNRPPVKFNFAAAARGQDPATETSAQEIRPPAPIARPE